ncbi:NGG1p interacting factor NIF3 [Porticoccus sp. GXU_MW_L64]
MYKLAFFVPESHLDSVKQAVFATGAGRIGDYDSCCWQVLGQGQFRPLKGSAPFLGQQGQVETVEEYRVEMVCDNKLIAGAVKALIEAHPYEEPAYDVWELAAGGEQVSVKSSS